MATWIGRLALHNIYYSYELLGLGVNIDIYVYI